MSTGDIQGSNKKLFKIKSFVLNLFRNSDSDDHFRGNQKVKNK